MEGLVRVSGIDYIILVNSIFISTRMTGQEVWICSSTHTKLTHFFELSLGDCISTNMIGKIFQICSSTHMKLIEFYGNGRVLNFRTLPMVAHELSNIATNGTPF